MVPRALLLTVGLLAGCGVFPGGKAPHEYCYLYASNNGNECQCFNRDFSNTYSGTGYSTVAQCDPATTGEGTVCCAALDEQGQAASCRCVSRYCQQTQDGVCQCSTFGVALDIPQSPNVSGCSGSDCAYTSSTQHVCICGSSTYGNGQPVTGLPTPCSTNTEFKDVCGSTEKQLKSCADVTFKAP